MISVRPKVDKLISMLRSSVELLTAIFIFLSIAVMFASTAALISITHTQVSVALKFLPNQRMKEFSDWLLSWIGAFPANLSTSQYVAALSAIVGAVSVIVTLWFSVTTTISYFRQRSELRRLSLIQEHTIYKRGKDDLDVMHRYYKDADWVVVFSGDFSWLAASHSITSEVARLASDNKITLVTYKDPQVVQEKIGSAVYEKIHHRLQSNTNYNLKCSVVCIGQRTVLLYVADTSADVDGTKMVCVISGKNNAQYLLDTITQLIRPFLPNI